MSRIFRRPMFRKGGNVGDGIMTGIVDREDHALSDPDGVGGQNYRERIMKAYDEYPSQNFDPLTQFLLEYGPELAIAKPQGSIIGTAVGAAKDPLKNLIANKGAENKAKRNIAMEGEILNIEGEIKKDVAQIQQRGALDIKKEYLDNVYNIKRQEAGGNQDLLKQIENDYQNDLNLFIVKGFDVSDVYNVIKGDEVQGVILNSAEKFLETNEIPVKNKDGTFTEKLVGTDDPQYPAALLSTMAQFTKKYSEQLKQGFAGGGRVGYAMGTPEKTQTNIAQSSVVVGSKNVTNNPEIEISYDELRSRLPKEISNEVIQMLSTSYEALADFAELRTQADVDMFNQRYGVDLVLPQEA